MLYTFGRYLQFRCSLPMDFTAYRDMALGSPLALGHLHAAAPAPQAPQAPQAPHAPRPRRRSSELLATPNFIPYVYKIYIYIYLPIYILLFYGLTIAHYIYISSKSCEISVPSSRTDPEVDLGVSFHPKV